MERQNICNYHYIFSKLHSFYNRTIILLLQILKLQLLQGMINIPERERSNKFSSIIVSQCIKFENCYYVKKSISSILMDISIKDSLVGGVRSYDYILVPPKDICRISLKPQSLEY